MKESLPTSLSTHALNSGDDAPATDTLETFPSLSTRAVIVDGVHAAPPHGRMVGGDATGGVQAAVCADLTGGDCSRVPPHPWMFTMPQTKTKLAIPAFDQEGLFNTRDQLRGALKNDAAGEGRTPLKRPSSVASRCSASPRHDLASYCSSGITSGSIWAIRVAASIA